MRLPEGTGKVRRQKTKEFHAGYFDGFWSKPYSPTNPGDDTAYRAGYMMGAEDRRREGKP